MLQRFLRLAAQTIVTSGALAGVAPLTALQGAKSRAAAPMGTYATATTHPPSSGADGCWLEAAPVSVDSIRMQILCRYPAPRR